MKRRLFFSLLGGFALFFISTLLKAQQLPTIPVGLDAYKQWDQWPTQRLGVRAYMRSTYDRTGGNESADASHFLFANGENENVTLDVKGKGVLYFFRANHWHGSPWHFMVDGVDHLVSETGTSEPTVAKRKFKVSNFIPETTYPRPLNWTWEVTKGADLIWTPMPFEQSMRIAYSRTRYGTGYYIYHLYANESQLSRPIQSFLLRHTPEKEVLNLLERAGTDIAPQDIVKKTGTLRLDNEKVVLADIQTSSPQQIRALKLTLPLESAFDLERIRLVATWDGAKHPSIDAPLCLFFGAGTLYNREQQEYLVKGLPVNIRFDYPNKKIELGCYFPMPFFQSAHIELAGITPKNASIDYELRYEPLKTSPEHSSYFHATYKDIPSPKPGKDLVYLDTKGIEGHDEWSGSFVGNSFVFSHNGNLATLEGDPRFYFDDSRSPQAYGTGTEEWGGGGDYWGGLNMTLPLAGHPCGAVSKETAKHEKDLIESAYRFLLADLMPFGKRAVIQFEHGGENLYPEHYEAVCYWYGLPKPSLVLTDELNVGNLASEKTHGYVSPEASAVYPLTSRFEAGIDVFPDKPWRIDAAAIEGYSALMGKEIYPEETLEGRYTRGTSEFTIKVAPTNQGILLRRTLDYSFPNQTAEVFIAEEADAKKGKWSRAGIWYLAGANTCMYSDPGGELDPRFLKAQTSNRQLREDEFLVPAQLTKDKSKLRVKVKFIPNHQELFPGTPFPTQSAWSELDYKVYSYVLPK
ncbi:MAG: DUF2961 domain-containing protein [Bacteroidetes bacterium]|nr:DUF2961 domain-containing protein [Bacteroidota bacterium]